MEIKSKKNGLDTMYTNGIFGCTLGACGWHNKQLDKVTKIGQNLLMEGYYGRI